MESNRDVSSTAVLSVIDPQNRTGKIQIPLSHVFETKGKTEAIRVHNQKDLSLCLLFQNGKCNVGGKCHQIHADVEFVRKLRVIATQSSTCCAKHGDVQSKDLTANDRTVLVTSPSGTHVPLPARSFAMTQGLTALLASRGNMTITLQRVCRLHQQNRCKYGRDCRHMHMCREAYNQCTATTPLAKAPLVAAPASAQMRISVAPLPLCADLILDETASHSSDASSDAISRDSIPLTNTTYTSGPDSTTTILDAYLKGWTPASTCAGSFRDPSPMFVNMRSPLDLRILCTEILGK
jgi:hypothetical protein